MQQLRQTEDCAEGSDDASLPVRGEPVAGCADHHEFPEEEEGFPWVSVRMNNEQC
jgi:hypothetical protein